MTTTPPNTQTPLVSSSTAITANPVQEGGTTNMPTAILCKSVSAVILSIIVAMVLFMLIEGISSILHPWPDDYAGTFEEIAHQVETYPVWVLALLAGVGYGGTMFLCTYLATRLGHNQNIWHGYGVGIFLFAMIVWNMSQLPYPTWYGILMFVELPIAGYYGTKAATANTTNSSLYRNNNNNNGKGC